MIVAASPKTAPPAPSNLDPKATSPTSSRSTDLRVVPPRPSSDWSDERLVQACLTGNQCAWDILIGRYKGLIVSFPRKYGADQEAAADVFQLVCVELFVALPRLRNHQSVRAWISKVAAHQAYNWKRQHLLRARRTDEAVDPTTLAATRSADYVDQDEEETIRRAVAQLPGRYRTVIQMLFLEEPPLPYQAVAERLGVAAGSVSFLRARGLRKLAQILCGDAQASIRAAKARRYRVVRARVQKQPLDGGAQR